MCHYEGPNPMKSPYTVCPECGQTIFHEWDWQLHHHRLASDDVPEGKIVKHRNDCAIYADDIWIEKECNCGAESVLHLVQPPPSREGEL